jgi:hypothetical protein
MLTVELIRRGARSFADRTAVLFEDKSLTFAEVDQLSNRFAQVLARNGIARGSRLAILANNSLHTVPVDFGCVKAGAARTPLNARLSMDEHVHMLRETGARLVIYDADLADLHQAGKISIVFLVLLGMGRDGHIASLYPDEPTLDETERRVIGAEAKLEPFVDRITLTLPMLRSASQVLFLITGADKAEAARRAFADEPSASTPASLVRGARTTAVLDAAAAALL